MRLKSLALFALVLGLMAVTAIDAQAAGRRGGLFKRLRGNQSCVQQSSYGTPQGTYSAGSSCAGGVCPAPTFRR